VQEVVDARKDLRAVGGLGDEIVFASRRARRASGGVVLVSENHDHRHERISRLLGLPDALEERETVNTGIWMSEKHHHDGRIGRDRLPAVSPFASSRTSKLLRIRRASVVRIDL